MGLQETTGTPRTIFVIEDEYFFATDLCNALRADGFDILGPASRKEQVIEYLDNSMFDFAVMDVNLHGNIIFDIADRLVAMEKPMMFVSGCFESEIPKRFRAIPFMSKPVPGDRLALEVKRLVDQLDD